MSSSKLPIKAAARLDAMGASMIFGSVGVAQVGPPSRLEAANTEFRQIQTYRQTQRSPGRDNPLSAACPERQYDAFARITPKRACRRNGVGRGR